MLFVCFRWSTRRSTRRAKVGVCWSLEIHRPTEFLKKLRRSRVRWGTRFNRELSPAGSEITTHHHSFLCLSVFPSLSFSMNIAENMRRTWKEKPWWTWTRRQDTWQHDMLAVCWTRFHIHTDTHIHTRACLHRSLFVSLQKEYRKDLEQEVKGRGLSGIGLEETPELLRIKNANQILNQVRVDFVFLLKKNGFGMWSWQFHPSCGQREYCRDLQTEILGKGMELSTDVLDIQRAKRASEIQSQVRTEGKHWQQSCKTTSCKQWRTPKQALSKSDVKWKWTNCVCLTEVLQTDGATERELLRHSNRHPRAAARLLPEGHLQPGLWEQTLLWKRLELDWPQWHTLATGGSLCPTTALFMRAEITDSFNTHSYSNNININDVHGCFFSRRVEEV